MENYSRGATDLRYLLCSFRGRVCFSSIAEGGKSNGRYFADIFVSTLQSAKELILRRSFRVENCFVLDESALGSCMESVVYLYIYFYYLLTFARADYFLFVEHVDDSRKYYARFKNRILEVSLTLVGSERLPFFLLFLSLFILFLLFFHYYVY